MHTAIIEFDSLADADGAAPDNHGLLPFQGQGLVLLVIGAVVIGCDRLKLCGTGINRLVNGT